MSKNKSMSSELESILFDRRTSKKEEKPVEPVVEQTTGQKADNEKRTPDGKRWHPLTLWLADEHRTKIHNLSSTLGMTIRETMFELLDYALTSYEKDNKVDLMKTPAPKKKSVF